MARETTNYRYMVSRMTTNTLTRTRTFTHTQAGVCKEGPAAKPAQLCALFEFEPIKFRINHNRVHKPVYKFVYVHAYVKQVRIFYLNII